MSLANIYIATHRDRAGYRFFSGRAAREPGRGDLAVLRAMFKARVAPEVPLLQRRAWVEQALSSLDRSVEARDVQERGFARFIRGVVGAAVPASFERAEGAVLDLEWVLENTRRFPVGIERGALQALAMAYATLGRTRAAARAAERSGVHPDDLEGPLLMTPYSVSREAGFRFGRPEVWRPTQGVHVARGYDFGDIAFVETSEGLVVIDAGTNPTTSRAALDAVREHLDAPIRAVLVTHAHWDHVGGIETFAGAGVEVVAQAGYHRQLARMNAGAPHFAYFFGEAQPPELALSPTRTIEAETELTIGGVLFRLLPVSGGETEDAMLVYLPDRGVLFVGDAFMPYLGAPFVAEGSPEGFVAALARVRELEPSLLVHGHAPLTQSFPIEVFEPLGVALEEVRARTVAGIQRGEGLAALLHAAWLPESLREHPAAVLPFLLVRDNFIQRMHGQRSGYWRAGREGVETTAPEEFAAALDLLTGGDRVAFVRAATELERGGDLVLALRIAELGLLAHRDDADLAAIAARVLMGLRARNQQINPFKYIVYTEAAGGWTRPVGERGP